MSEEDFFLGGDGPPLSDHPDREAFKATSDDAECRRVIYEDIKKAKGEVVFVRDLEAQHPSFHSGDIYRAARILVRKGLAKRVDAMRRERKCVGLAWSNPWEVGFGQLKGQYVVRKRKNKSV